MRSCYFALQLGKLKKRHNLAGQTASETIFLLLHLVIHSKSKKKAKKSKKS